MDRLRNIVTDRSWYHTSAPLEVFEGRLKNMEILLITVLSSDASDSVKNEARKQYLVMLVTCYETYVREVFKIILDENLVPTSDIFQFRRLKNLKFTLEEVEFMKKESIELSELIAEYINFQNFEQMVGTFSIININEKIESLIDQKDGIMPPLRPILTDVGGDPMGFLMEFQKAYAKHVKMGDRDTMYAHMKRIIAARHKIIHRNIDIEITQEDIYLNAAVFYEFVILLDFILQDLREIAKETRITK